VERNTVAIVGAGVVGTALGVALREAGRTITVVASRSIESARAGVDRIGEGRATDDPIDAVRSARLVLLTVPDRLIADVALEIAEGGVIPPETLTLHTSGFHSSRVLSPIADSGGAIGSLHPLQSFATVEDALRILEGTRCFFEGDDPARIRRIVEDLGGVPIEIDPDQKPLYHAAAATASNLLVTVVDLALAMAERAGLDRDEMLAALLPLVRGSVENIGRVGVPDALTGPIARGDIGTVEGHLRSLARTAPDLLPAYTQLALRTVDVALRKGSLPAGSARDLVALLKNVDPPRAP
jgi:predicted short-subunit dehydrogenase-like oxidoreductase (DUF2520 family)